MTSNIYIINHKKIYEIVLRLFKYLKESWDVRYYPTIDKIIYDLNINDSLPKAWFEKALSHLISRNYISITYDSIRTKRIYTG